MSGCKWVQTDCHVYHRVRTLLDHHMVLVDAFLEHRFWLCPQDVSLCGTVGCCLLCNLGLIKHPEHLTLATLIVHIVEVSAFHGYIILLSIVEEDSALTCVCNGGPVLNVRADQALANLDSIYKLLRLRKRVHVDWICILNLDCLTQST